MSMTMSPEEIVRNYNQAKDRNAQITILADLNVCSKETIIEILRANGVDGRKLPHVGKRKDSNKDNTSRKSKKKDNKSIVEPSNVFDYINSIKERRANLVKEVQSIDRELSNIAKSCSLGDVVKI